MARAQVLKEQYDKLKQACDLLFMGEFASIKPAMNAQSIISTIKLIRANSAGFMEDQYSLLAEKAASLKSDIGKKILRLKIKKLVYCPICLSVKKYVDSFKLGCGHKYCKKCIISSLSQSMKNCSLCRQEITSVEGDHLYKITWNDRIFKIDKVQ